MDILENTDVISIMEKTLNLIDTRLINHGRRVSSIVHRLLSSTGRFAERELRDICIVALLHDIGAYKTEEIDEMVSFETRNTWDHAIYGYLFFKYFSPLQHLAPVLLHHHTAYTELELDESLAELAQVLFVADRLDVYTQAGIVDRESLLRLLEQGRGRLFAPGVLDLVEESGLALPVTDREVGPGSDIDRALHGIPLTNEEIVSYLKMIVLFIDFRSHQTLTHTLATTSICDYLAGSLEVDDTSRRILVSGMWLHDIGKTGIPLQILEKPGSLTVEEMSTIRRHVDLTDEILRGNVTDEVRRIAARHHEKLDGSGYPAGRTAPELTICERIAVVADIFSALCGVRSYKKAFPKEEVVQILLDMVFQGLLDPVVVNAAIGHYDGIIAYVHEKAQPVEELFGALSSEFEQLTQRYGHPGPQ